MSLPSVGVERNGEALGSVALAGDAVPLALLVPDGSRGIEGEEAEIQLEVAVNSGPGHVGTGHNVERLLSGSRVDLTVEVEGPGITTRVLVVNRVAGHAEIDDTPVGNRADELHGAEDLSNAGVYVGLETLNNSILNAVANLVLEEANNEVVEPGKQRALDVDRDLVDVCAGALDDNVKAVLAINLSATETESGRDGSTIERGISLARATREPRDLGALVAPLEGNANGEILNASGETIVVSIEDELGVSQLGQVNVRDAVLEAT